MDLSQPRVRAPGVTLPACDSGEVPRPVPRVVLSEIRS